MAGTRLMHFINQFFAGKGGENEAGEPVGWVQGTLGPGKLLQTKLGSLAEVVATAYCGDDYFNEHQEEAKAKILEIAREQQVDLFFAGPAFASGRYGFMCSEVCHFLSTSLGVPCITAMYPENPGVQSYRQFKDSNFFLFPTSERVLDMEGALTTISEFISRLGRGAKPGNAVEEGYMPRGIRVVSQAEQTGARRALEMALDKICGRPFRSEIPIVHMEQVPPPPAVGDMRQAALAILSTSGVVPGGNPDGFKMQRNTQWRRYSVESITSMTDLEWDVRHGGYNNVFMLQNPNYGVPIDVCKEMEKQGVFKRLYPYFYSTPGINGLLSVMQQMGHEMALDMKHEGVDAALLVST
jgi:betaine reductase